MGLRNKNNNALPSFLCKRLSEIESKPVEWLWHDVIPIGELTIIDGDPSTNKSTLTIDLAARVSRGTPMPYQKEGRSGNVLLFAVEDSVSKTIVPRLEAAGADLQRIAVMDFNPSLPEHIQTIEKAVANLRPRLVIFDPISAFIGPDASGDQRVRKALQPLQTLADEFDIAIVLVRHLTKQRGGSSLYRGLGSIGIVAACRSALLVAKSPDNPQQRVLCQIKSNLGPLSRSLLFEPKSSNEGIVSIEWLGECEYVADDLLKPPKSANGKLGQATDLLAANLKDGGVKQSRLVEDAQRNGVSKRTLERAKDVLGVVSKRNGWGPGSHSEWRLP